MRRKNSDQIYIVGQGGSPEDTWIVCFSWNEAIDEAWGQARKIAKSDEMGMLGFYEQSDHAGVCPDGDEGGYWPVIHIK